MRSLTFVLGPVLALTMAWTASAADTSDAEPADLAMAAEAAPPGAETAPAIAETGQGEMQEEVIEPPAAANDEASVASSDEDSGMLSLAPGAKSAEAPPSQPTRHTVSLGPVGHDADGNAGRIHLVVNGDTLWDISDAYLGTPWVWPSVWSENEAIENPHLIRPGDRLWISPTEIRRVSSDEADALLAGMPASPEDEGFPIEDASAEVPPPPTIRFSGIESTGFVSDQVMAAAASLVDNLEERTWLGSKDRVLIGLGAGEVEVGEQFTVFRAAQKVYMPGSDQLVGHYVNVLGWLEVQKVYEESALAEIRMSFYEMTMGDKIVPRERAIAEIELRPTPPGVEAEIIYMPDYRTYNGSNDVVFLNRGSDDGLEPGNTLEVFRPVGEATDAVRRKTLQLPPRVVAQLVVVEAQPESSVALVRSSISEVRMGDRVRPAGD